ncbi:MAG: hypothetical protein SFV22_08395, partial [Saprospiraceae bacterium]|nr:hypothetical protein [Saprospiraceae bacterium]
MTDLEIIKEIEKELGVKLSNVKTIDHSTTGFTVNGKHVTGIGVFAKGIKDISIIAYWLSKLNYLTFINFDKNQIEDITPLKDFVNIEK